MAKLILSVDGQVLKEFTLSKERTLIGRKPHNDIQIDNLAVSGEHAAIITILNDSFIEDLGSTNGTMVNGKPVKKHFLQANDVIEIGKHKLKYFNDAPSQASAADFEKTMIIRSPAKPAAAAPRRPRPRLADRPPAIPCAEHEGDGPAGPARLPSRPAAGGAARRTAAARSDGRTPTTPRCPMPRSRCSPAPPPGARSTSPRTSPRSASPDCRWRSSPSGRTAISSPTSKGATFPTLNGASLGAQAHPLCDHDMIEIAGVKMEFFFKQS